MPEPARLTSGVWTSRGAEARALWRPDDRWMLRLPEDRPDAWPVRVWNRKPVPRLGCIAVRAEWRRGRLTPALLGTVGRVLLSRGVRQVTAETDEENRASMLLARRLGAVPGRVDLEWVAPAG